MTFLPVIRSTRSIEIGLAGYRKRKAHLMVSRIISLHGIAEQTLQVPHDALSSTNCPRCRTLFTCGFFFCGPRLSAAGAEIEMLTRHLGELCLGTAKRCHPWRRDHRHRRRSCCCWQVTKDELDSRPVLVHTWLEPSVSGAGCTLA